MDERASSSHLHAPLVLQPVDPVRHGIESGLHLFDEGDELGISVVLGVTNPSPDP